MSRPYIKFNTQKEWRQFIWPIMAFFMLGGIVYLIVGVSIGVSLR